jgi:hypothetical protein
MLSVGSGKTSLDLLAPIALNRKTTVLLLPPGQVEQTCQEAAWVGQHLRIPRLFVVDGGAKEPRRIGDSPGTDVDSSLFLVAYSTLSRPEASDLLERLQPTFVIADEAHKLRHKAAATTRRVMRYLADHEDCAFACWSGTLTSRSLRDFAHLAAFSLREGSPLPLDVGVIDQWAECFDAGQDADRLCGVFREYLLPGEDPRDGLRRRMFRTAGVIGSISSAAENLPPLKFVVENVPMSQATREALKGLEELWALPSVDGAPGEELTLATEIWQARTELLCGFHYRWDWNESVEQKDRQEWCEARAAWHRELRGRLSRGNRAGFDSPALIERAMLEGAIPSSENLERWHQVRSRVAAPVTVPVWIDDAWLKHVVANAKARRALVWFTHDAVGRKLAEHMPVFFEAEGMVAALRSLGAPCAALSRAACGQGVDGLQRLYNEQTMTCPYSSGEGWEQLLGRLHRQGQLEEVRTAVLARDLEYVAEARERCGYVRRTMGLEQKLLLATGLHTLEGDIGMKKTA